MPIPITRDLAGFIGDWAERVENRGLLVDKFPLAKCWGNGKLEKVDDASRWSILRIVTDGPNLLAEDSRRLKREASGRNVQPDVHDRKERLSAIAEKMAVIAPCDPDGALARASTAGAAAFYRSLAQSLPERVVTFEATLSGRLLINMAGGVIENAGLALDRCFGSPFIPGSAIKGIARSQALWEIHETDDPNSKKQKLLEALLVFGFGGVEIDPRRDLKGRDGDFVWAAGADLVKTLVTQLGCQEFRGCLDFVPARPVTPATLVVDMINSHHPQFYGGRNAKASDNEQPIPNYFPAVEAGSVFGFAVVARRSPPTVETSLSSLLDAARGWIQRALTERGVGAKTAAGYGWFELGRKTPKPKRAAGRAGSPHSKETKPPKSPWTDLMGGVQRLDTKDNFPVALPKLAALTDDDLRLAFDALIPENERRKMFKKNPYWQSFTSGKTGDLGKKILERLGKKLT